MLTIFQKNIQRKQMEDIVVLPTSEKSPCEVIKDVETEIGQEEWSWEVNNNIPIKKAVIVKEKKEQPDYWGVNIFNKDKKKEPVKKNARSFFKPALENPEDDMFKGILSTIKTKQQREDMVYKKLKVRKHKYEDDKVEDAKKNEDQNSQEDDEI